MISCYQCPFNDLLFVAKSNICYASVSITEFIFSRGVCWEVLCTHVVSLQTFYIYQNSHQFMGSSVQIRGEIVTHLTHINGVSSFQ